MPRSLGFTQDITTCDYCGRSHLKGTYAIEENDTRMYYGSTCMNTIYGKAQAHTLKARADIYNTLRAFLTNRAHVALLWLGWSTRDGWIVDELGQPVIEAGAAGAA